MAKTIMTVDDSASVRQLVCYTLREAGYEVIEAVDGRDALRLLKGPIHLVVSDVNMPGMDGIELVKNIRELAAYKYTPVIMLTTESLASKKQAGKAAGATAWIVKPFTPEQLLGVVKKVLG